MTKRVVPMIHVPDVAATVDWYRDIGFRVVETYGHDGEGLSFAILAFGGTEVMFNQGGQTSAQRRREVDLYVYTDDVEEVYQHLKDRVEVVEGLHDTFYGMRELIIRDLNRFWITFGQSSSYGILMDAVREGEAELVRTALNRDGLNPEALTNALVVADAGGNKEILELLRRAGATPPPALSESVLQAHAGKYKSEAGMRVEINLSEGTLYAIPSGQERLRLIAMDEVTFRPIKFAGVTVRFKVADGKTTGFVLQDGTSSTQLQKVAYGVMESQGK